jgi:hypothetical protein
LHNLFLLLPPQVVLVIDATLGKSLDLLDATSAILFDLHRGQTLLLVNNLILHAVLLLYLEGLELLFLFVLLLDNLRLFCFFTLRLEDGLLDLSLLILALLAVRVVVLSYHPSVLVLALVVVDFLSREREC